MGLLDALFNSDTYAGQGAGLLDLIRSQSQYMPSPMFAQDNQPSQLDSAKWPAGPVGAPSSLPVGQPNVGGASPPIMASSSDENDPIPVGNNYSMPRIGSGFPENMEPAPRPQMASMQPPQAPTVAPQSSQGGFGAGLSGFVSNLHTGPLGAIVGGLASGFGLQDPATQKAKQAQNLTLQSLIQRGIDPTTAQAAIGNPELFKQVAAQAYGPKTLTPLGNGYVADRSGKITRAYEPDDKIPFGWKKDDNGNISYIPNGPQDPAYLRLAEAQKKDPSGNYVLGRGGEVVRNNPDGSVTVLHKNEADAPEPMDPASLEILARREIGGDFSGRKNLGRGAQGAADLKAITNKSSEILTKEMGMSTEQAAAHLLKKQQEFNAQGQGLNAEARTTGVREANLNLILKAADAAIPAALEASDKVSRTGWVPLNKVIQGGQVIASDPDLKKFGMANLQLAEHWARAMNPTGVMRESDRDKALSFLSTADSKDTYKAAVGQLRTQIERERDAVKSTRGMSDLPGSQATAAPTLNVGQSTTINGVPIRRVN